MPDAPNLPLPQGGNDRLIALLALDQAAWALAGRLGLHVADGLTELNWAMGEGQRVVWAPYRMTADEAELRADPVALTFLAGNAAVGVATGPGLAARQRRTRAACGLSSDRAGAGAGRGLRVPGTEDFGDQGFPCKTPGQVAEVWRDG
ncbi:hypothetical protein PE067_17630 [Paracoccus sp. DMF-8]|uniref:hypothetical protein n=1 Tax=Paracoccus sp. DMF-8 TaxID=3019445 RepID=UPI0023E37447|nr:hypothetical protein [Paracoccus sp. DMF-8]MDF3607799.1 hypothetical protein [Paracoccus sp. DMF-8]